ncbi:MAG: hypothetical protein KJP04_02095 [Arenicella sp.]|nr:hypothetical protein [Arenicella sp.]
MTSPLNKLNHKAVCEVMVPGTLKSFESALHTLARETQQAGKFQSTRGIARSIVL